MPYSLHYIHYKHLSTVYVYIDLNLSFSTHLFILGGTYIQYKNKREHYLNVQKKRIELFFEDNTKDFENVKLTKSYTNPTGSITIEGYINNDKKMKFYATLSSSSNFQFDDQIGNSNKLETMFKTNKSNKHFPSEIIKEKHLNKEDYEADPPFFF